MSSDEVEAPCVTEAKMTKRGSGSAIWRFKNWSESHAFLVAHSRCLLEIGDDSFRFFLRPSEEIFSKPDSKVTLRSYDLCAKVHRSKCKNLCFKVSAHIKSDSAIRRTITIGGPYVSSVVLDSHGINTDCKIFDKFLFASVSELNLLDIPKEERYAKESFEFSDENTFKTAITTDLEIRLKVKIFIFSETSTNDKSTDDKKVAADKSLDIQLFENDTGLHDVHLKMKDQVVLPAHRAVLAIMSPVFRAMFTSDMKESVLG